VTDNQIITAPVPASLFLRELGYITVGREGHTQVLRLAGDIDTDAVVAFEQSGLPEGESITVVDLTEVTFLSSTGVAFLIRQTQPARSQGHLPVLRGLTRPARRILELTGTSALFDMAS
jgi:anti-sigma B factor antagonist